MLGTKARGQTELPMAGPLRDLIPDDHVLARVDRVLDLSWLRAEVRHLYAADGAGRPGIDPEAEVRLMLAGFLLGIVHDRRLMREARADIAIRWSAGYSLHEALARPLLADPRPQALRRGAVPPGVRPHRADAVAAGIAKGEVMHIDATLIRAHVAWDSLGERHAGAVPAQDDGGEPGGGPQPTAPQDATRRRAERDGKQTSRYKKVCLTDPDATVATNARNRRLEPAYK